MARGTSQNFISTHVHCALAIAIPCSEIQSEKAHALHTYCIHCVTHDSLYDERAMVSRVFLQNNIHNCVLLPGTHSASCEV